MLQQVNLFPNTDFNFLHTSKGKNDECYTKRYAVEVLLEFLMPYKDKIIWCPFDKDESQFVQVLKENGFKVVNSHIDYGQDFYAYEPEQWDILVSNPPFTNKKEIFKRALSFGKPFALIMNVAWLLDSAPAKLFENKDLQLLLFKNRMEFDRPEKTEFTGKVNFSAGYFCWNFLPKQIIFRTLQIPRRKRHG